MDVSPSFWKIPCLGLLLSCHLQDNGRGFFDGVQHAAHAQ